MEETTEAPIEAAVEAPVEAVAAPEATEGNQGTKEANSDPYSSLNELLDKELAEKPAETPEAPAVPEQFTKALAISEFVKSPEHIESAVRAADEVWKVATGKAPASSLMEGIRASNPDQYANVLTNLAQYIEQVTGKKFGGDAEPLDPRDQRLSALEQRYQQEEQQRQQQAAQQQVSAASKVAGDFVSATLKGTFAEGYETHYLALCEGKTNLPQGEMVRELLQGNTKPLATALKAVRADEVARMKAYVANFTKMSRTLQNGLPATKGAPATGAVNEEAYRPGETAVQYATRRFNAGV